MSPHVQLSTRQRGAALRLKRMIDVVGAAVLLVVLVPVLAALGVAIRLDSPGPALYRAARIGRQARVFEICKFRSMREDTDDELHARFVAQLLTPTDDPSVPGPEGAGALYKLADDPRVTRVGRVIRRLSLDEVPQLLNVLAGDMSLVGPRPEVPYALEHYEDWHWRRFAVLPGMTGLWQVSGRGHLPPLEMLRLDVEYVDRWSLWLDCRLLARTIPVVLRKVGSG